MKCSVCGRYIYYRKNGDFCSKECAKEYFDKNDELHKKIWRIK